MKLPLEILLVGDRHSHHVGETRDISSGGVCFSSVHGIDQGARVEYVVTLPSSDPPVKIRCLGKVVRVETKEFDSAPGRKYEISLTLERYSFVRASELEPLVLSTAAPVFS